MPDHAGNQFPPETLEANLRKSSEIPRRNLRAVLYAISFLMDCLALYLGYFTAIQFVNVEWLSLQDFNIFSIALPIFVMFLIANETQSVEALENSNVAISKTVSALSVTALFTAGLTFVLKEGDLSRSGLIVMFGTAAVLVIPVKLLLKLAIDVFLDGRVTSSLLLIDGMDVKGDGACDVINVGELGIWPDPANPHSMNLVSRTAEDYDRAIVATIPERRAAWANFLKSLDVGGEIVTEPSETLGAVKIGTYSAHDTLVLSVGPLSLSSRIKKRASDLVISTIAIILLSPVLLLAAAAIRLTSPGPVIFAQTRVGLGTKQFRIYKFRTMHIGQTDPTGAKSVSRCDQRVTPIGRFLRRTSIDELPQFFNVLIGDMSLVGPRPHALSSVAGEKLFWEVAKTYWIRHAVKPGITGLAQVRGWRGNTENEEDLRERVRCDLEYVLNWSLLNDLAIMLRTIMVLVHPKAY